MKLLLSMIFSSAFCFAGVWPFKMGDNRQFDVTTHGLSPESRFDRHVVVVDSFFETGKLNYIFTILDSSESIRTESLDTLIEDYRIPPYDWSQHPNCPMEGWYPDSAGWPGGQTFSFEFQESNFVIRKIHCGSANGGPTGSSSQVTTYLDSSRGIIYRIGVTISAVRGCGYINGKPNCFTETALKKLNGIMSNAIGIATIVDSLELQATQVRKGLKLPFKPAVGTVRYGVDGRTLSPLRGFLFRNPSVRRP